MAKSVLSYVIDRKTKKVIWYSVDGFVSHVIVRASGQRLTRRYLQDKGYQVVEGKPPEPLEQLKLEIEAKKVLEQQDAAH